VQKHHVPGRQNNVGEAQRLQANGEDRGTASLSFHMQAIGHVARSDVNGGQGIGFHGGGIVFQRFKPAAE
jgi:hypothetical protein